MRFDIARTGAAVLAAITVAMSPHDATGQQDRLQQRLIGTWRYVSVDLVRGDGSRTPLYGPAPRGRAVFDASGNYLLMTSRGDLPAFRLKDRAQGSPQENEAIVHGSIAHFGTYTVSEADRTITFHIETSTFPNWNGSDQKRPFTITGDELTWRTPASSGGGTAEVVLKRVGR